jgi:transcriptional regulator with XRE-family HTH domain
MSIIKAPPSAVLGQRLRHLRELRGWSQEKVGVEIGLDESSARTRISRYELGVHEPPIATARLLAKVMDVPLAYLYCDDEQVADLLLALHHAKPVDRKLTINRLYQELGCQVSSS